MSDEDMKELENLRLFAAKALMNPFDRAFFDVQMIIDNPFSNTNDVVLAKALMELRRVLRYEK